MTKEEMRVAIAEAMGYKGCVDVNCDWRKASHLHKDGKVYFPESFSIPMYPDYPNDLNAMAEAENTLTDEQWSRYRDLINEMAYQWACEHRPEWKYFRRESCTSSQRAEAFLRTVGKWKD